MATQRASKYVKCPFYHYHDANRIVCEGLMEGNTINLVYKSTHDRFNYFNTMCCDILSSRDCPVHMMLMQKYEEV